jgi:hypothetical protein
VIPLVILKCHQEPIQKKNAHLPAKKKTHISDKATFLTGVDFLYFIKKKG